MLVNLEKLAAMNLYLCYRFLFGWWQGYVRSMSMLVPPSWDHKIYSCDTISNASLPVPNMDIALAQPNGQLVCLP